MGRRRHHKKSSSSSSSSGCQKACNNDNGCQSNNQPAQSCPQPQPCQPSCSYYDQLCGMMQSGMNCFEAQTPMKKAAICVAALWSGCKLYKHHEKKKCEKEFFTGLFDYCCADVCADADDCDSDSSKWCHCDSESKSENCSESSSESCKKPKRKNCKKNNNNNNNNHN